MSVLDLILTGVLLGSMLLFVALVAPTVFKVLDKLSTQVYGAQHVVVVGELILVAVA